MKLKHDLYVVSRQTCQMLSISKAHLGMMSDVDMGLGVDFFMALRRPSHGGDVLCSWFAVWMPHVCLPISNVSLDPNRLNHCMHGVLSLILQPACSMMWCDLTEWTQANHS